MKNIILTALTVMSFTLIFAGGKSGYYKKGFRMLNKIEKKLDLNETQKNKLTLIKTKWQELKQTSEQRQNNEKMKDLVLAENLEESKVKAFLDSRIQQRDLMFKNLFPLIKDFHASLSQGQKQEVLKIMKNNRHKKF